jgi:hypothetical protein
MTYFQVSGSKLNKFGLQFEKYQIITVNNPKGRIIILPFGLLNKKLNKSTI